MSQMSTGSIGSAGVGDKPEENNDNEEIVDGNVPLPRALALARQQFPALANPSAPTNNPNKRTSHESLKSDATISTGTSPGTDQKILVKRASKLTQTNAVIEQHIKEGQELQAKSDYQMSKVGSAAHKYAKKHGVDAEAVLDIVKDADSVAYKTPNQLPRFQASIITKDDYPMVPLPDAARYRASSKKTTKSKKKTKSKKTTKKDNGEEDDLMDTDPDTAEENMKDKEELLEAVELPNSYVDKKEFTEDDEEEEHDEVELESNSEPSNQSDFDPGQPLTDADSWLSGKKKKRGSGGGKSGQRKKGRGGGN